VLLAKRRTFGQDNIAYLLILPFFLFFFFFRIVPVMMNFILSFTRFDLVNIDFIGLENYKILFRDKFFIRALANTGIYTLFTIILTMPIAILLAVLLNTKIFLQKTYRAIFFLPHVTSMVSMSMVWLWLYEPSQGVFNQILSSAGFPKILWLHDVSTALPSIIVMSIWKFLGYYIIIYLAGLQGIPNYLYEAATIDGATTIQKFFKITFPMLKPVTFFLFVTGLINNFNVFEQILIMTDGGPMNSTTTIVHQVYARAFFDFLLGYASAIAFVGVIIIAIITFLNFKYGNQGADL